jgi:predicted nucleotidyltransferase
MTDTLSMALDAEQVAIIKATLATHLPPAARVMIFGSRATGRARPYSDLDLALDAGRTLTLDEHARLAEALSESDLPFKVDIVDLTLASDAFRAIIGSQSIPLT